MLTYLRMILIKGKPVRIRQTGLHISAEIEGRTIGRINFHDKGDGTVLLGNIEVSERVVLSNGLLVRLVRRFFPEFAMVSPRNHGVGTLLLRSFVTACNGRGVREIFGNVTPEADLLQPFLKGWYEKEGFIVAPPDGRDEYFPVKYKVIRTERF